MQLRGTSLVLLVLYLLQTTHEQAPNTKPRKNAALKKAVVTLSMIEDIKKQIAHILEEVSLLKENQALHTVCLRGMKVYKKCFLLMAGQKSFHEAADDCILHGGTLSTPHNHDENDALYDYARTTLGEDHNIWVGVTDISVEGDWMDVSSKSANYTNWEMEITKQPDGGTKANCVALSGPSIGKWFDESCSLQKNYFCQFNIP
ncbi:tetranectin isoform X1 [Cetorhinus maximus]